MNRGKKLDHLLVVASAGTGKTHQLVERALELLVAEILPHSLVVITFTKKAAQEIVDRLFSTLAQRALPSTNREEEIELDLFSQNKQACRALKILIEHLPYLHFQTIDSFFYSLLNYIPLDKRASFARFSILDEKAKKSIQVELIRNILSSKEFDPSFVDNFEVFFGDDLKTIFSNYLSLVQKFYPFFSDFPRVDLWGDPRLATSHEEIIKEPAFLSLLDQIESFLKDRGMPTKTWEEQKLKINSLPRLYQNILKAYDPQTARCDQITLERKKYSLDEPLASALGKLAGKTIDYFIEKSHHWTRAVAHLLSVYDLYYRKRVTKQGFCSFEDIPRIILEATLESSYPLLYRLDKKWDHFLIDEFQDTSFLQWKVIKLFVDELIQYQDGSRSFFCVGDPKQSIYGWRGACGELIESVESQYKLRRDELNRSRRSARAILDFVNMIFGNFEAIGKLLPECLEGWNKRWVNQQAVHEELEGYSCFLGVETTKKEKNDENFTEENGEEEEADNCVSRYEALKKLLVEEIKPQERHLSCAILVQTNREAEAIFQQLSLCSSLRVSLEGKLYPGKDSLIGKLFFALVQALAHPGDSLALGWLKSSPLGSVFQDEVSWRKEFWRVFFLEGFEGLAFLFFSLLQQIVALDDFHKERMEMILQICQAFDKTGNRNFEQFLSYYKDFSLPLSEDPSSVQVRTVHSAKGLEFDVVIVTELRGCRETAMNKPRDIPIVYTSNGRESKLFFLPPKEITDKESQLSRLYKKLIAEEQLEKLSLLYVAMTRARQGLYLVGEIEPQTKGKNSTRQLVYWQDLLLEGLGITAQHRSLFFSDFPLVTLFETGKRKWNLRPKKEFSNLAEKKDLKAQDFLYPPRPLSRTQFVSPSTLEPNAQELNLYSLFSLDKEKGADHGLIVHKIFAQIEQLSEDVLIKLKQRALEYDQKDKERNPFKEVLDCLQSPSIKQIFCPREQTKVWIERSFCVEVERQWVWGTFDRVHVEEDWVGNVQCSIYDFKADAISWNKKEELVKKYFSQLVLYRKALCQLLNIDPSRLKVFLVSVYLKEVMAL
ncbi:UvrD-helicase domain-containing protein [Methylacidiphilum caldifontis]|uniref:DNA 3'-5' helicase n=1 Tax=Methylacidiphilum caldifontis TaxID=2795386 RepID=A0A4Y8P9S8_9BACT|nr:UvrD-helicase domain-containing protein [Methylacidiphilum caldifontis]TFE67466.1 exonuclease V subunit beta [Methylacidiphilum caldifontis]